MKFVGKLLNQPKSRQVAVILALLATVLPIPIAGVHKFYLGQPLWGVIYLLLWSTPIPRIASAIDAVWYLVQDSEQFNCQFNNQPIASTNLGGFAPSQIGAVAEALRELDRLREDGLVSEYEFEQKRRQLLDRIA
ncbi:putative membrane protein [Pleurocapsa sp. PCC 7327]|uniref:NINE protein n=1 Tax=Pleurocapsa sp. PCC 7327 TaxID=118163 RepID=UPI00029FD2D7|nr:NINE protein [Pleurocapsa sp. PCC 7327]AFY77380.1 putative membrane protein [Pleurocapsa sp. PCC 7327]